MLVKKATYYVREHLSDKKRKKKIKKKAPRFCMQKRETPKAKGSRRTAANCTRFALKLPEKVNFLVKLYLGLLFKGEKPVVTQNVDFVLFVADYCMLQDLSSK